MIQEIQTINWAEGSEAKVLNEIHRSTTNISIYNRDISHLNVEINELLGENIEIQTSGEPRLIHQYKGKIIGVSINTRRPSYAN